MKKEVLKFLFMTDTHHTAINPTNRLDDCFLTTLDKVKEIGDIVQEEHIDYVLHGGDFFNSPNISDNVASTVGKVYQNIKAPIIVISGNHDVVGNNASTISQTKLGLLGELGIVRLLNKYETISIEKGGVTVDITGSPSDFGINNDKEAFIVREKTANINIHMVHAMLLKEDAKFGTYMPLSEIQKITKANITLSGDFHLGFEPVEYEGKVFINPGALVRKYNFIEEIERKPQVVIITIYDDKTFDYELRKIKCAKSGSEVLDRSVLETKQLYEQKLEDFKKSIESNSSKSYTVNINEIIEMIAKQDSIEDKVIKVAIEKIDTVKKELKVE